MTQPNLVLCKASAGSGKTYTLAKMYLQIVLDFEKAESCNYDRILAVTFTNKATEEMKTRILDYLTEISQLSNEVEAQNSSIAQSLLLDNPNWDFQTLVWKAKIALGKILHDYSQFSIMTIDKFFTRIVKAFLFELKLQNRSTVSMDTETALNEALVGLLDDYSHDKDNLLSKWLKDFATDNLEEGKSWHPEKIIQNLSKELFKEDIGKLDLNFPLELLDQLHEKLKKEERDFTNQIKDYANQILEIIKVNQIESGYFSSNYFPKQTKRFLTIATIMHYSETILKNIEYAANPFNKTAEKQKDYSSKLLIWENEIVPLAQDLLQFFRENIILYNTAVGFRKYIKALGLLSNISEKMKDYREKNSLMFLSDNNQLIQRIVGNTTAPFLYERIGNKFRYILLDEFQDTSNMQWENLLPLIIEVLSHSESCKVLIVGDAKQAIYRWRGGNLQLIQNKVQDDLKTFWDEDASELILNKNFRSLSNIITFNNQWITHFPIEVQEFIEAKYLIAKEIAPIDSLLVKKLYTPTSSIQELNSKEGGFVEWKFINKKYLGEKGEEGDEDFKYDNFVAGYLNDTISKLIGELGYAYKDIAILVKTNKEAVKTSDFLKLFEIPVMTSEALLFSSQEVIKLIIGSLKLLLQPEEGTNIASVLYSYKIVHQNQDEFSDIFEKREEYLLRWIPQLASDESIQMMGALSIYDIVRQLISILNLEEYRDIYVEQFLDMVFIYQSDNYQVSISSFLEWWEKKEKSISISGETDAVQIATIHKSKGLEFNVVILPYFMWNIVDKSPTKQQILWPEILNPEEMYGFHSLPIDFYKTKDTLYVRDFQKEVILQASDNLNVAYVALTRAKEKLYVASNVSANITETTHIGTLMYNSLLANQAGNFVDEYTYQFGVEEMKYIEDKKNNRLIEKEIHLKTTQQEEYMPLAQISYQNEEAIVGEMIHEVLSLYRPGGDLEKIFTNISYRYPLDKEIEDNIHNRIRSFFAAEEIQNLYKNEGEFYSEREFVFEDNLYRFDLLILNNGIGKLYDFKTGQESTNKKRYIENIKRYRQALQDMKYNIIETALIYINQDGLPTFEYID